MATGMIGRPKKNTASAVIKTPAKTTKTTDSTNENTDTGIIGKLPENALGITGKTNNGEIFVKYEGKETETAKTIVDNVNRKISVEVKSEALSPDYSIKEMTLTRSSSGKGIQLDITQKRGTKAELELSTEIPLSTINGLSLTSGDDIKVISADMSIYPTITPKTSEMSIERQSQIDVVVSDGGEIKKVKMTELDYTRFKVGEQAALNPKLDNNDLMFDTTTPSI